MDSGVPLTIIEVELSRSVVMQTFEKHVPTKEGDSLCKKDVIFLSSETDTMVSVFMNIGFKK